MSLHRRWQELTGPDKFFAAIYCAIWIYATFFSNPTHN